MVILLYGMMNNMLEKYVGRFFMFSSGREKTTQRLGMSAGLTEPACDRVGFPDELRK